MSWAEWAKGQVVEPSLYSADFARLGEQIEELLAAGCRMFHFDVGDGYVAESITMGPVVLDSISGVVHDAGGRIDVHLMVEAPATYFETVAKAGGDSVTFHFEGVDDVAATIAAARAAGLGAGVAFNPESEPDDVAAVAGGTDLVLCLAIRPGDSGQPFGEETFDRVRRLRAALPGGVHIQVEGGVGSVNAAELRADGARLLVAASSIFGEGDPARAYRELAQLVA